MKKTNKTVCMPLLRGTLRLKIDGLNQSRLLSNFIKAGIPTKNIQRENSSNMIIDINKKDSKKTFAILQNLCYNYSIVGVSGAAHVFSEAITRIGLVVGIVVFTALITLSRGFVWKMEIDGCNNVSKPVIEALLKNSGVEIGKSLKNIDKTSLKNKLNNTSGVVESSVEIRGTTVIVKIMESVDYAPKTPSQSSDIVSKFDAQITKITSLSGTCLVQRGQKVFKGAPLIGAYRLNPDGEKAENVNASGMIFGKVNIASSVTLCTKQYILTKSGKTYSNSILKLFGFSIGKSKNPFESYCSKKETLYMFDSNFIPIKLEREKIYETQLQLVEQDLQDLVKQKTSEYVLQNIIKCGGSQVQTTTDVKPLAENIYTLNIFIQAEMPLC